MLSKPEDWVVELPIPDLGLGADGSHIQYIILYTLGAWSCNLGEKANKLVAVDWY